MAVNSFNAQNPPVTTKGDLFTFSTIPTRLAVGTTNGHVLQVDSTAATGLKWAAASAPAANYTLLNTGGTNLTGAATVTVSGISGKSSIFVFIEAASSASITSTICVRLNADTGNNYGFFAGYIQASTAYDPNNQSQENDLVANKVQIGRMGNNVGSVVTGFMKIEGANTSGVKPYFASGAGSPSGGINHIQYTSGGYYNSSSTISSVSIFSTSGNLDSGKVYVYTSDV